MFHGERFVSCAELVQKNHRELASVMAELQGMVILSGYPSALYRELYGDWECLQRKTLAEGARPRMECLWFNAAAWERRPQVRMFAMQGMLQEMVGR
jgi:DNA adenine methylase